MASKDLCLAEYSCLAPKSNFIKKLLYTFDKIFYAIDDYAMKNKGEARDELLENMKQWLMELNTYFIKGAIPHKTTVDVLSAQELKKIKIGADGLNWKNAATMTMAETIRNPFRQQAPEDKFQRENEDFQTLENQKNYQLNQAAVRKEMLGIIKDISTYDLTSGRKLRKRLAVAHKKLLLGENGDTPYFPITLLRVKRGNYDLKYLKKIAGKHTKHYDVKDFDALLYLIKDQLEQSESTRYEMASITDIYSRFIRRDADFGYAHASYVFEYGNNSLFMNMINTILKLRDIPAVSHYHFDHKAIVLSDFYNDVFSGFLAGDLSLKEVVDSFFEMDANPASKKEHYRELFKAIAFRMKWLQHPVDFVVNDRSDIHISA